MIRTSGRRGMGLAAVILLLAMLNLAVVGSVAASGDEAEIGAMQVKTCQAFYAAESGAVVIVRCTNSGLTMPVSGATLALGGATVTFDTVPSAGAAGDAVIEGSAGASLRRIRVTLEAR